MITKVLTVGLMVLAGFNGFSQEETEQERECKRARFLAGEALKVKNYPEATMYYIKGEKICGGYDKANYDRLIGSLQYTINEEKDQARKSAYIDTVLFFYDKTDSLGFFDKSASLNRGLYELQAKNPNGKKVDKYLGEGIRLSGLKANESYVQYYYQNLYKLYAEATAESRNTYKQRLISEYFVLSKLATDAKMSVKTQENLTKFFNDAVKTCSDLLPELKGFMSTLPQETEAKKMTVNNFIKLLEDKSCTDSKEYEALIDTLIKIDPSVGAVIAKAKLMKVKKRYSEAIETFKQAKAMESDTEKKEELEYEILVIQFENLDSYRTAYNTAMGINGSLRGKALGVAARCVMNTANSCGTSTFERKCNYYYVAELAERAGDGGLAAKARANFPTSGEIFDEGKSKGQSVSLSCWNVSVTIK